MASRWVCIFATTIGCSPNAAVDTSVDGANATDETIDPGPQAPVSGIFNGVRIDFPDSPYGFYSTSQNQTHVGAGNQGATLDERAGFSLAARGNMAGTFSCGDEPDGGLTISMTYSWTRGIGDNASYSTTGAGDLTPCSITFDVYGAVGERVRGTFSGVLVATARSGPSGSLPPQRMEVTDGVFDVVRGEDVP